AAQMRGDPSGAEQPSAARHVGPGGTAYVEGAGPPGGTQLVDPQDASPAPASDSEAARTSAAAPTQGAELDEVVAPPGPASDETGPSSSAALTHTADSEARLSSPRHSHPLATEADRDSLGSPSVPPGSASPLDLNSPGKDPPSRALLLVLCFVLGAALSVGLAYRMG